MFKVLIITYYCTNNYGSYLQAWALGDFFIRRGCDVHYWGSKYLESLNTINVNNKYRVERDNQIIQAQDLFNIDYDCNEFYDLAIVGSDVVWASTKIEEFWGRKIRAKKIISYAASMWGMNDNESIPLKIRKIIEKTRLYSEYFQLRKFSGISVRDQRTERAIKSVIGRKKEVVRVVDPTFIMQYEGEYKRLIDEDYVLVYSYALIGEDINPILEYAKLNNCKICLIGYRAVFADYNLAVSPFELLSLFKYAKVVFTTTFHGTALSIINKCNFVMYESKKGFQLLEEFGLESRKVTSDNALEIVNQAIDYSKVDEIINKKRDSSIKFLEKYVPEGNKNG